MLGFEHQFAKAVPASNRSAGHVQGRRGKGDLKASHQRETHSHFSLLRSTVVPQKPLVLQQTRLLEARTRKRFLRGMSAARLGPLTPIGAWVWKARLQMRLQEPITNRCARLSASRLFVVFSTKFEG
jgi:hypothetical protein